ncbi:hypothetical protein EV356DRAFT_569119 [Viridothelium virens]|uniref:Uncharacterized protein n=1 Tax=Viridothelium virens TaxID=1048519 RepID=A0A6A6H2H8_VIRVR|nr:hypothetical protein EV356DRAFT_569119 [Viridothelium virens]
MAVAADERKGKAMDRDWLDEEGGSNGECYEERGGYDLGPLVDKAVDDWRGKREREAERAGWDVVSELDSVRYEVGDEDDGGGSSDSEFEIIWRPRVGILPVR